MGSVEESRPETKVAAPERAPARRRGFALPVILGVIKGGALGAGAAWIALQGALPAWLLMGVLGSAVGVVAGRPFWRRGAWVATLLKGAAGFPVGLGGGWLIGRVWFLADPWIGIPAFAALWALLLEIDDSVGEDPGKESPKARGTSDDRTPEG